ncbi:hypothetical protein MANES_14G029833v8 [Manihot esculenta]|uniref:Uncharacterized protein n=6 Tax=Manihot esculenta TaxID=3983 RepID=A0ACB7GDN1_MANES|nr:hypothetical protein MANES_14G029833v8 [Manihot esculenta]KAG8638434.1 hypothetical protein MANES_14G029833v8 [Manihot esculenta]KAG8638435.1 hypothetical protein MANES_14G029833v8 [Manihot esculenta]KAG8638436.1 hypothetical protein MANES_14G029833v8 [Manihot esculenta]KAG8638437.1 hypothetical protein MANES_14G029833v8 [Manihot esculenta]
MKGIAGLRYFFFFFQGKPFYSGAKVSFILGTHVANGLCSGGIHIPEKMLPRIDTIRLLFICLPMRFPSMILLPEAADVLDICIFFALAPTGINAGLADSEFVCFSWLYVFASIEREISCIIEK